MSHSFVVPFVALAASFLPALTNAETWNLDPAHSAITFSVKHFVLANARGQFRDFSGTVAWDEKDIQRSKINVTIDAKSIDTNQAKRDEHLRGPDFFDVAKFPTLSFVSTRIDKGEKNTLKITGDLTLHGVTKPVVLVVDGPTPAIKSPLGGVASTFHASTSVNRKDFGLVWNAKLDNGGLAVGDEVKIELDGELTRKPEMR